MFAYCVVVQNTSLSQCSFNQVHYIMVCAILTKYCMGNTHAMDRHPERSRNTTSLVEEFDKLFLQLIIRLVQLPIQAK